jgi:hypothetical protein
MEITLYALFLGLITILIFVRNREIKRRSEGYYLRAYFEIFEHPIEQRAERILAWEDKAYKQAYPDKYNIDTEISNSEKVVSIHKAI